MPRYTVTHERNDMIETWGAMRPVLQSFAKELKTSIYVMNQHGDPYYRKTTKADRLNILFWSAPTPSSTTLLREAFGITLGTGQRDGWFPTPGYPTLYDPSGVPVAQVNDNLLYILFDLPHPTDPPNQVELLSNILELYRQHLGLVSQSPEEQLLQAITLLGQAHFESQAESFQYELDEAEHSVATYSQILSAGLEKLGRAKASLATLRRGLPDPAQYAQREVQALGHLKQIESCQARMGCLVLTTQPIQLSTPSTTYLIGKFEIWFRPDGGLKVVNITGRVRDYDHPHIHLGKLCVGNLGDIYTYAAAGQYALCTNLILEFLHTYTPESQYTAVDEWPAVGSDTLPVTAVTIPDSEGAGSDSYDPTTIPTPIESIVAMIDDSENEEAEDDEQPF